MNLEILDEPERSEAPISFWQLLVRWERYRLLFNLLVGGAGLLVALIEFTYMSTRPGYWRMVAAAAWETGLSANLFYCVFYLLEFGHRAQNGHFLRRKSARLLFWVGALGSAGLLFVIGLLIILRLI